MIGKKIVCMRKNAEINCLPQRCIWKKLSAETTCVIVVLSHGKLDLSFFFMAGPKSANLQHASPN